MHLLVAINNNVEEWRALQYFDKSRPRLPLSYIFGGAFLKAGHSLSAIDLYSKADKIDISPFQTLYHKGELSKALEAVDVGVLWGSDTFRHILRQAMIPRARKNIIYFTYAIALQSPSWKQWLNDLAIKALAGFAKGIVVMTSEQERSASEILGHSVPVIRLQFGIDTAFYRAVSTSADIPKEYKPLVESLLKEPYVIMPGDELRFNDDAIRFVEKSGIRLVRISQFGYKSGTEKLKNDVLERNISDRLIILENISYPFLRFLLQHASAYAGLVDSSWQPAGWTVACEALASGLPMVVYEGLVSGEMSEIDAPERLVQAVPLGDITAFTEKLSSLVNLNHQDDLSQQAITFSSQRLDFEKTAPAFVGKIERLMVAHA